MTSHAVRTASTVLGAALAGGVLAALPAEAASAYQGTITATGGLTVRHLPTTASAGKGTLAKGKTIEIVCQVRGSTVGGNDVWYALPPTLNEWVSARYVHNLGPTPRWCGSDERFVGKATATVRKRTAPTTAAPQVGTVPRGAGVDVICKLPAQNINGNKLWYYLIDGRWVSAYYVTNVGRAPRYCN